MLITRSTLPSLMYDLTLGSRLVDGLCSSVTGMLRDV